MRIRSFETFLVVHGANLGGAGSIPAIGLCEPK